MKTTYLRSLIAAIVCLFAGVQAQAQFSGSAEQYPTTGYEGSPIAFALSEVATSLGTDAATLGAAIDEYVKAETPATLLFAANGTAWTAELEAANHGFWMAADGTPVGYSNNPVWYCSPEVDEAFTTLTFNVGQMPSVMKEGDKGETTITLSFNDKQATFALTLNVIAKPVYDIPAPATLIEKDLNVVGEKETVVEQYPRGGYDSDVVKVVISDVLTALGIDNREMVAESLDTLLYATVYNTADVEQGGGMKKDSVSNTSTANAVGWWVRPVQNENGEETGECASAGWGDTDRFFMESFAFNVEGDTLSCNLGQYPGSCKDNEQYFTYIYFIYGDKAYRMKYTLKLLEKEQGNGLADYTKVGEGTAKTEQAPTDDYSTTQVNIDVEAIAAALGCEVGALGVYVLDDKDNFGSSTANNGGWWLNSAGTVTSWGTGAAFFIEPPTANDWSVVNVGQYPNTLAVGDEVSATLNFVNGTNYYPFTITLKIVEPTLVEHDFESVETRAFALQAIPTSGGDYQVGDLITIAPESIEAVLGITTPTLYGLAIDSVAAVTGTYSNKYSCDPKPGFWLNKDGRVSVWGDADARVGISWIDNSVLRFFSFPGRNSYGDVFTTQLFLVNEETNKMITLNITLSFVETLVEKEVVGTENIKLPVSTDEIGVEIDLTKPAEALDVTVEDLLSPNNYYLRGLTAAGIYGEGQNADNGLTFTPDGSYDGYGSIYFYLSEEDGKTILTICSNDPVAEDWTADTQFCFEVDDKQYVYYAKMMSAQAYESGINDITADKARHQIYDLSGRQVMQPKRGIYIQNGNKLIVK